MSRRMGAANKMLLPWGDSTVAETTLHHLLSANIGEIIVVTGFEAEKIQAICQGKAVKIVHNPEYETGMTTSIQAGIRAASPDSAGFMICLADMPLIQPEDYQQLADVFAGQLPEHPQVIVQPFSGEQPGNPIIFSSYYRTEMLNLSWPEGCKPIVQANRANICRVVFSTNHFITDLDTPEEYAWLNI